MTTATDPDVMSPEFEAAFVNTLLTDIPFARRYLGMVKDSHVREPAHREVIKRLKTVHKRYEGLEFPDRSQFLEECRREVGNAEVTSDAHLISELLRHPITPENARSVRNSVKDWLKKRHVEAIFMDEALYGADVTDADRINAIHRMSLSYMEIDKFDDKWDWHTPSKALSSVGKEPRKSYPCWVPELETKYGIRLVEGTTWMNTGSTGRGKSLYQAAITAFYVWSGIPCVVIDYENDEEDFWIDLANTLFGMMNETCPSDLTVDQAIEFVSSVAKSKCGSPEGIVFVSFEDAIASDEDVQKVIESIEEETHLFYPIVCLDALGDMTSETLEQSLRSEWAAQRRMIMRLTAWIKQTHRILFATLQTNRQGEADQRNGKEPGIDNQAGGIAFAKKAKIYCAITDAGLKVLKFRRAGHLRKKLLPFEYVKTTIQGNQRGYVRCRLEEDIEQNAKWRVVFETIRAALAGKQPLKMGEDVLPLDYAMTEGMGCVQAGALSAWLSSVGDKMDLKRKSLLNALEQRNVIDHKEDITVGRNTRTFYFLRCSS